MEGIYRFCFKKNSENEIAARNANPNPAALLLNEIRHTQPEDENNSQQQHHSSIHRYLYESKASSLANSLRGSSSSVIVEDLSQQQGEGLEEIEKR